MHSGQKLFVMIIVASAIVGSLVLLLKKDYSVRENIRSNRSYYPNVQVDR